MARRSTPRIGRALRAYVDTSVFGGVYDREFREPTIRFFAAVRRREIVVLVSPATADEANAAPESIQALFLEHRRYMELVENTKERPPSQKRILPPTSYAGPLTWTPCTSLPRPSPVPMSW